MGIRREKRARGLRHVTCAVAMVALLAALAWAGAVGTAFEGLGNEVDARTATLGDAATKKQRKALRRATRELRRVDRGLVRDLTSARKLAGLLLRAFPGDATLGGLLDGLLDDLSDDVGNSVFDTEARIPGGAGGGEFARAERLLGRAQDRQGRAATAATAKRRAQLLRLSARAARRADAEITRVLAPDPEPPIDPGSDGPGATGATGTVTLRVNSVTTGTNGVDATYGARVSNTIVDTYTLDAQWNAQPRYGVSMTWQRLGGGYPLLSYVFGERATGSLRRGDVVFDLNVTGDVQLTAIQSSTITNTLRMQGTYRIQASSATGQTISATGTFDVANVPITVDFVQNQ